MIYQLPDLFGLFNRIKWKYLRGSIKVAVSHKQKILEYVLFIWVPAL
jgi:hypothetical protein